MELEYVDEGTAVFKNFQVAAAAVAGVPLQLAIAGVGGLGPVTAGAAATFIGLPIDGQTSGIDAGTVKVCTNAGQTLKARLSGDTSDDTALTIATAGATGSTTLINNITGLNPTTPDIDDGMVWFIDGVNKVGGDTDHRAIILVATAPDAITVENAFRSTTVSGDTFLYAVTYPGSGVAGVTLTTSLQQVVQDDDNATLNFVCVGAELGTEDNSAATNSSLLLQSGSRAFGL